MAEVAGGCARCEVREDAGRFVLTIDGRDRLAFPVDVGYRSGPTGLVASVGAAGADGGSPGADGGSPGADGKERGEDRAGRRPAGPP